MDKIQRERKFHDSRFADDSERQENVGRFYKIAGSIKKRYRERLLSGCQEASVLEYGCGTGGLAFELARAGAKATGIDISQVALDLAGAQALREGLSISFVQMNAEKLDLSDGSFDRICGTGILHHLDLGLALREMRRVLRPDGRAVFIEPLGHNILINLYRRFTPKLRTTDEHPLLVQDLCLLKGFFEMVEIRYFYLTTLALPLIMERPERSPLTSVFERLDGLLFMIPFLRRQAWQVLIEVSVPRK